MHKPEAQRQVFIGKNGNHQYTSDKVSPGIRYKLKKKAKNALKRGKGFPFREEEEAAKESGKK